MHIPARGLAGGKKPLQHIGYAVLVCPDTRHGIVLGRTDRDQLGDGIDSQEIIADFFHFPELGLDVLSAHVAYIEPKVVAVRARHPMPFSYVVSHPSGDHITRRKLCLLRLVFMHESFLIRIK
jgi:hypothetical protein